MLIALLPLAAPATAAEPAAQWRVLLVYSYGREFSPFQGLAAVFREELGTRAARPVEFYEATLDLSRRNVADESDDATLTQYLRSRFTQKHPDLIVSFGGPATRFLLRNRAVLFPATPLVIGGVDTRMMGNVPPGPLDTVTAVRLDPQRLVDTILEVRPGTRQVMVVLGASPHEQRWLAAIREDVREFDGRLTFTYTNDLTLEQIRERAAAMPADSAILYGMLSVDAAGIPYEHDRALREVYAVARVPIFGLFASQFGRGIVGGPLFSTADLGRDVAASSLRILAGESPSSMPPRHINPIRQMFDWRELNRWGIPETSLPRGSVVEFRPTSLWEQHAALIIGAVAIFLLQAGLIIALTTQRARRRMAESEARNLNRQLLFAHEDEKRRLARDLHDDFSHRLARLSMDAARLERTSLAADVPGIAHGIRAELAQLSEDMHAISHSLHPSVLEDLGLVDALRTEGDLLSRTAEVDVVVEAEEIPRQLPIEVTLCAFRVAQEALRNIGRHAQAGAVSISVRTSDDKLTVSVSDDGVGFDAAQLHQTARLGHASMRERVRLLGGELTIRSVPGRGTTIETHLPLSFAGP
jgi:signal transduction histidine kinase